MNPETKEALRKWVEVHLSHNLVQAKQVLELFQENENLLKEIAHLEMIINYCMWGKHEGSSYTD